MIQQYEALSMNAWPSLQTLLYDGWILRFANGITKRANSINPLYPSTHNLETKIAYCEALYHQQGLPAVYKLTPGRDTATLDSLLASRGYQLVDSTSLQTLTITETRGIDNCITLSPDYSDQWLRGFIQLSHKKQTDFERYKRILMQLKLEACYLSLSKDGQTIGCGLGVIENGHLGIFDLVVSEAYRSQGNGRSIIHALLSYAKSQNIHEAYLQGVTTNIHAQRLYSSIGFKECYRYWYRVEQTSTDPQPVKK